MAKKKKIKKSDPESVESQALALAFDKGIKPYNAAIVLGMSPKQAFKFTSSALAMAMSPNTPLDIAERLLITPRDIIVHLTKRAGLQGEEGSAKRIVSMVANQDRANDFIEVEDHRAQLAYMQELIEFLYKAKDEAAGGIGAQPIFNINFTVLPENATPDQADRITQIGVG